MIRPITLILAGLIISANARDLFKVVSFSKLLDTNEIYFMNPKWSPDGNSIAVTSENYKGLWVIDLQTKEIEKLSEDLAVGFAYEWSPDGSSIVSSISDYKNYIRKNAVALFHVENKEKRLLTDFRPKIHSAPKWRNNSQIYFFNGKELEYKTISGKESAEINKSILYKRKNKIQVIRNVDNTQLQIDPQPGNRYLNLSLSPDGNYISFEIYGGNLFIKELNSGVLRDLGRGYRPSWSPDSKHIVYMLSEDDGYRYTSSDLYIYSLENESAQNITKTRNIVEMNPSWSATDYIICSTNNDGSLYLIELKRN